MLLVCAGDLSLQSNILVKMTRATILLSPMPSCCYEVEKFIFIMLNRVNFNYIFEASVEMLSLLNPSQEMETLNIGLFISVVYLCRI
jgi:hypothetical protein